MTRKGLFVAALASVVVYGLGDLASGLLYDGYSYKDQWISELSAFGSPVRPLMVTAILIHGLLLLAFGVGIWRFADRRSLRWVGLLLIVAGVIGLPTHTVFAMSSRWMTAGFNDTMHASLSLAFGLVVFVAVAVLADVDFFAVFSAFFSAIRRPLSFLQHGQRARDTPAGSGQPPIVLQLARRQLEAEVEELLFRALQLVSELRVRQPPHVLQLHCRPLPAPLVTRTSS